MKEADHQRTQWEETIDRAIQPEHKGPYEDLQAVLATFEEDEFKPTKEQIRAFIWILCVGYPWEGSDSEADSDQ